MKKDILGARDVLRLERPSSCCCYDCCHGDRPVKVGDGGGLITESRVVLVVTLMMVTVVAVVSLMVVVTEVVMISGG